MKKDNRSNEMPQGAHMDSGGMLAGGHSTNYTETNYPTSQENADMQYAHYEGRRYMSDEMGPYYEDENDYGAEEGATGNEPYGDYQEGSGMNGKARARTIVAAFFGLVVALLFATGDLHAVEAGVEISSPTISEQLVVAIEKPAISAPWISVPSELHAIGIEGFTDIKITQSQSAICGTSTTINRPVGTVAIIPGERILEFPARLRKFSGLIHSFENQDGRWSLPGRFQGVGQSAAHFEQIEWARIGRSIFIPRNAVTGGASIEITSDIPTETVSFDVIKTEEDQIPFQSDRIVVA